MPKQSHDLSVLKRKNSQMRKEISEEDKKKQEEKKKKGGKWGSWCRTLNHPSDCACAYL